MKKWIFILTALALNLFAANAQYDKLPLPDGFQYGKVSKYVGKTTEENNMISQFNTYFHAMSRSDITGLSTYIYPDVIKYFKRYAPTYYSDRDIIRDMFKATSSYMVEIADYFADMGLNYELVIDSLIRRVRSTDALIYVFNVTTSIYNNDYAIHSSNRDLTIGVSLNNGRNWTFMALNDDSPNILRLRFSQSIINQIMGY